MGTKKIGSFGGGPSNSRFDLDSFQNGLKINILRIRPVILVHGLDSDAGSYAEAREKFHKADRFFTIDFTIFFLFGNHRTIRSRVYVLLSCSFEVFLIRNIFMPLLTNFKNPIGENLRNNLWTWNVTGCHYLSHVGEYEMWLRNSCKLIFLSSSISCFTNFVVESLFRSAE